MISAGMALLSSFIFAANVTFSIYIPPHAASDGVRYQLVAPAEVPATEIMRSCRIDDFAIEAPRDGLQLVRFAVTRATEGSVQCLRSRLPQDARVKRTDGSPAGTHFESSTAASTSFER